MEAADIRTAIALALGGYRWPPPIDWPGPAAFRGRVTAVSKRRDEQRRAALAAVAPGTALREGLERILRGSTGALIVLGYDQVGRGHVLRAASSSNVAFSATRLRELAKMDGAIVLDPAGATILRAAVQLVPDPSLPTGESGTRHRTAERVARQTGYPVISVSKSMRIIAVYTGRRPLRARGLHHHPVPRAPGPGHAGALQAPPRPGHRGAVRPGDRGPGHGQGRHGGGPAGRDGPPDRRRDRGLHGRAGHRRAAARPAARRAGRGRRTPSASCWPGDYVPAGPEDRRPGRRRRAGRAGATSAPRSCWTPAAVAAVLGLGGTDSLDDSGEPARLPAAGQGPPAARPGRRRADRPASAACRSCWPPA